MSTSTINPLAKHFRQPSIYLQLPSNGRFYPDGSLELSATGEFPVYPMTVKDEISFKTPDALMNGQGMADVIVSCCHNIKDPWSIPVIDLDPLLIAIRMASYGPGMDITSDCPKCLSTNENTVDLRGVLDSAPPFNEGKQTIEINTLMFEFKPQTYKDLNNSQQVLFEQQKIMNVVTDSTLTDEDKQQRFNASFAKLTELNVNTLVICINSITTEDNVRVTDSTFIKEFLSNTDRKTYDSIRNGIEDFVSSNAMAPINITCNECTHVYKTTLEFNQSNFFE
jgi:hypothetical protein